MDKEIIETVRHINVDKETAQAIAESYIEFKYYELTSAYVFVFALFASVAFAVYKISRN